MKPLHIISAKDLGNLSVLLYFNDNTQKVVDVGDFIHKHPHPQYNKYLNPKQFAKFKLENGNIVWGEDWDLIFPLEQLYKGLIDNKISPKKYLQISCICPIFAVSITLTT